MIAPPVHHLAGQAGALRGGSDQDERPRQNGGRDRGVEILDIGVEEQAAPWCEGSRPPQGDPRGFQPPPTLRNDRPVRGNSGVEMRFQNAGYRSGQRLPAAMVSPGQDGESTPPASPRFWNRE